MGSSPSSTVNWYNLSYICPYEHWWHGGLSKSVCVFLQRFVISAETYGERFCCSALGEEETPNELKVRLKDLYNKWMVPKEVKGANCRGHHQELLLKVLNSEPHSWIKEQNEDAAELAKAFLAACCPSKRYPQPSPAQPHHQIRQLVGMCLGPGA